MHAISPVTTDPQREIPGVEAGHDITFMLAIDHEFAAYHCRLQSRAWRTGELIVTWPKDDEARPVDVRQGQAAIVEVWPQHDALYTVEATVTGARREVPDHIALEITGEWKRVQRRDNVRFTARIAPSEALAIGDELRVLNASIRDISASGLRVWSGQEVVAGEALRLVFRLPDDGLGIDTTVAVERVEAFAYQNVTLWEAGCTFGDLPQAVRDRIVRYIFSQQRALAQLRKDARQMGEG